MARVADHLSVEDLEARLRSARDPTATRHFQVIWLVARGHTIADVAAVTSFVPRWIEQLLARYNAHVYRPQLVRHLIACYAAITAGESWFCRTAAGVWNPCRSMSQVVL